MSRDAGGYADLRDYAAIGDGRTIALVATDARIDWLPLPQLDSPPVFAALLDYELGGYLGLEPVDDYTCGRSYLGNTNVLVTTFRTTNGECRVTDSLNSGVAGALPWAELARRVDGVHGTVRMRATIEPGTCLNTAAPYVDSSFTTTATVLRSNDLMMAVQWSGEEQVEWTDRSAAVEFDTSADSCHVLGLLATEREPLYLPDAETIAAGIDRTVDYWKRWSATFHWDGGWPDAVQRSALVLKQLIQFGNGSMAAAATMALPESVAGGKNWDYRFAWTRDSAYALTALLRFGLREEVHTALSWLLRAFRLSGTTPQVMYTLDGTQPDGTTDRDVPGWRGIGPVVEGNRAADQLQLGVYGDIFGIVRLYVDAGNVLDAATARSLGVLADEVCDRWRTKDSGMWELSEIRHYTTSKLGCWQALTHAVHLAQIGQVIGPVQRWQAEADAICAWVAKHCWDDEVQSYVWYPGTRDLDASILLHAISGFDRGPRMRSTIRALRNQLGDHDLMYRYTGADRDEATFTACAFWVVSAMYLTGDHDDAIALMDRLVERVPNDVGVISEMLDTSGEFLGNLPQALSHLALVNAAITASGY